MAESAKEAFKVSNQVSEILRLVSDYDKPLRTMQALSHSVDAIAARSQGKFSMASPTQRTPLTSSRVQKIEKRRSFHGSRPTSIPSPIMILVQEE